MALKSQNYHISQQQLSNRKLSSIMTHLPPFAEDFFRGIAQTRSPRTRTAYAYDLNVFFQYIHENHKMLKQKEISQMTTQDLELITPTDLEKFMDYLQYYTKTKADGTIVVHQNAERGIARKVAAIRTLYTYFFKRQKVQKNPAELVDFPKIHEKNIVRLESYEVVKLLNEVESGDHLSERQKKFHQHTKLRDLAIITLLLGTGMRLSECVGINLTDIDFELNAVKITRKGGNESILYFGEEVKEALLTYIAKRNTIKPRVGNEGALFLSMQNSRINVRSVEILVKKYASLITKLKKISPHKLRTTFGTNLYRETGDIYLVADVLGHKDVNTTRRHYSQIDEERRKKAAEYVNLRK